MCFLCFLEENISIFFYIGGSKLDTLSHSKQNKGSFSSLLRTPPHAVLSAVLLGGSHLESMEI